MLSIWTNIGDAITKAANTVKDFFIANSRNPFLWVGMILLALLIFEFLYKNLHKKD